MKRICVLLMIAAVAGCEAAPPPPSNTGTTQLIEVRAKYNDIHAKMACAERYGGDFQKIKELTFDCTVGKNGLSREALKQEGDGKTPNGIYTITRAFGYAPMLETGLNYKPVTKDDIWIDDPESPDYNLWKKKPTAAKSYEELKRDDELYEFAAVIEYNTNPVVPGKGSAIFIHVWGGPDSPTAGCVALDRSNLLKLLKWLDVKKKPKIVIAYDGVPTIKE